jgi:histone H3/H4
LNLFPLMSSLPTQRATNLRDAYRICDDQPLVGTDLDRYYVDLSNVRNTQAIESVSLQLDLQQPGEFKTLLFTGHRGGGKSTELRRIQSRWEQEYRTIYIEIDLELDINDAEYTDLYLLFIKKVTDDLNHLGLKFDSQLLKNFELWFKEVMDETEESVQSSVSIESEASAGLEIPLLSKLLTKVIAQIRGSTQRKKVIREILQKNLSRLQTDMNLLLDDAYHKLRTKDTGRYQKGFLLIVDNLDRVPPNVGNHLFFEYATQLQELNSTIIYTVPIFVVYSDKNLTNVFGNPHTMPMINIYEYNREDCELPYRQTGIRGTVKILQQRVDLQRVFSHPKPLRELVQASGGHVRQLMQIMQRACLIALTRKHDKIRDEDVEYAIKEQQFNFERFTLNEHYERLARVCLDKDVEKDELGQKLLFNTSVLEYNGQSRWNYVNPVLKKSDAFQKALQSLLGTV